MSSSFAILIIIIAFFTSSTMGRAQQKFWLTANIEEIVWQDGCLTTALCSQPRLQIQKELLPIAERISISWPVTESLTSENRRFVSFWPAGKVGDISLAAQVVGVDRTYGFPRICDQTPSIRIFSDIFDEDQADEKTMHIKAKCFEAKIKVTRHMDRCPWCVDPEEVLISNEIPQELRIAQFLEPETLQIAILALALFAVITTTGFSILLILHLKSKRQQVRTVVNVQPKKLLDYEDVTRYNAPWDQKPARPLPFTYHMSPTSIRSAGSEGYHSFQIPPPPSFLPPV